MLSRDSRDHETAARRQARTGNDRLTAGRGGIARIGTGGIGPRCARPPLNRLLNLRGGAQFFDDTVGIDTDGIQASGDITLQNVHVSVDIFPFRHSSFHHSPGITLHNDNHIAGPINIPAGQNFSLGDQEYTSDPANPVYGFARLRFGNLVAPRFTVGFGNMLPRSGSRFSVPVEVGFEYTSAPQPFYRTHRQCLHVRRLRPYRLRRRPGQPAGRNPDAAVPTSPGSASSP